MERDDKIYWIAVNTWGVDPGKRAGNLLLNIRVRS